MEIPTQTNMWAAYSPTARAVTLEALLHGPIARKDLSERTGLSPGSLSRLTKPLIEAGILRESEDQPRLVTGGRPLQPLEVNPNFETFVGIKLTADHIHLVVTNLRAEVHSETHETLMSTDPVQVASQTIGLIHKVEKTFSIHAVGICLGGAVEDYRRVRHAPFLGWDGLDLAGHLERDLQVPCYLSNDLEALTCLERWFGPCRTLKNFTILTTGAGVGLGVVIDREFVTNPDAGLGLLGHQPLNWSGPTCTEGHHGCASAYLDIPSVENRTSALLKRTTTYDQVIDLASAGDPQCAAVAHEAARAMGTLASIVGNTCLPERVVITGEGWRMMSANTDIIRRAVAVTRPRLAAPLEIEVRPNDPSAWAAGAAALAIEQSILIG